MTDRTYNGWTNYETWVASLWAALLGAALSEANWREIAEHLLENVEVGA